MAKYDIVIGSNFGDESKGTIVARIAKEHKDEKVLTLESLGDELNLFTKLGKELIYTSADCYLGI